MLRVLAVAGWIAGCAAGSAGSAAEVLAIPAVIAFWVLLVFGILAGCVGPVGAEDAAMTIPVTTADGQRVDLQARLCRPPGEAPARLVVIAHGSPPHEADRLGMQLSHCTGEVARWFTARGYAVLFTLRRGYGATGGAWAEGYGGCARADYARAGLETARDIDATITAGLAMPGIQPNGAVLVGQSAGGWGAIAYGSQRHPGTAAILVMAGGRGGHHDGVPNRNCRPDRLAEAAGQFGATSRTPMLWIYAENDSFFAPEIAAAMHRAFTAAGGRATLLQPGPFDGDGHRLLFGPGGSAVWGPAVKQFLAQP